MSTKYWATEGEFLGVIHDDRVMYDQYQLPLGYKINANPVPHDDRAMQDEWQREVYEYAAKTHAGEFTLDLGCGSAWKLLEYARSDTLIGVEVEPMLSWLKQQYPYRAWRHFDDGPTWAYTLICADVIEHVQDPDAILAFIEGCKPNRVFISTPDRDLVGTPLGPPENPSHVREWSFSEFRAYLESRGWKVLEHFHSNKEQGTQLAVCEVANG